MVHGLPSLQFLAVPLHTPLVHTSVAVHASPSVQDVPFGNGTYGQASTASQALEVHTVPPLQTTALPGWQLPLAQWSPVVHALLSSHAVLVPLTGK